ncbi:Peptidase A2A, retrovirus RVP subgroup [Candidatus Magnetomorum sp. HK-1]|nr:Peptidase A2A, retrovirus RVP subgroup [Candidatus Magnetomorum sp. HK-1]
MDFSHPWIWWARIHNRQLYSRYNCIVDTGSASTAVDINIVSFNYQKPAIIKMLFGIGGGEQEVVSQEVDSLKLGQETFKNINIEFGDLAVDFGINGFIGTDLLSQFLLSIDFIKQEIIFSKQTE